MTGKGYNFESDILLLVFKGTTITGIAVNDTGTPLTAFYIGLHTASTGLEEGTQATDEVAYTNYARTSVARNGTTGWDGGTTNTAISNHAAIGFPTCGVTGATVHSFVIGTVGPTGTGKVLYWGDLNNNLSVASGITPSFAVGAMTVTEE